MKLIYTRPDGGVAIVSVVSKESVEDVLGSMSDEDYMNHVYKVSIPKGAVNVREIEESDIPDSREFRDAWVDMSVALDIDLNKAKELKLAAMRTERNIQLSLLDTESLRALENKADDTAIIAKKQALRDSTEALKALDVSLLSTEAGVAAIKDLAVLPILEDNIK